MIDVIRKTCAASGRMLTEDGGYINVADVLGGTPTGQTANINHYAPLSGRMIKEDGTVVNIAERIGSGGGTGSGATADQLAQIAQNAEDIAELKGDLANKLPKSPVDWESWTAEERAMARENIGIHKVTQAEYDALTDTSGIYIIVEE